MKANRKQETNVSIIIDGDNNYLVHEHDMFIDRHRCYHCDSDYIAGRFGTMMLPYLLTPANGRKDVLFTIIWG